MVYVVSASARPPTRARQPSRSSATASPSLRPGTSGFTSALKLRTEQPEPSPRKSLSNAFAAHKSA
eukprot:8940793-Heterocapsa_arctica.AAC.1